jgi:acyl-CoA thioesterase FadM
LDDELELEARVATVEGRKVITRGTISHRGEVTARAEGVFIRVSM